MKYNVFTKTGTDHEFRNKENEDDGRIVVNGDYVFSIISDGAGSSKYAKEAARTTVESTARFCFDNGAGFFDVEKRANVASELVFFIQKKLKEKAAIFKTVLDDMQSTLVLLCLDTCKKEYVTIHIGDGLICKLSGEDSEIVSFPENGATKQFTYMVNSPDVMKHLRISKGGYTDNSMFLSGSDGVFEKCYSTEDYIERVSDVLNNKKNVFDHADDMSYNIIEL